MLDINNKNQKGVSLYLTIVILSVLTAAILTMISISVSQIKVIQTLGNSVIAFYGADTGIERVLYGVYKEGYIPALGECPLDYRGTLDNGASYEVCVSDESASIILSTGSYKKTKRRIEINF
ncbi:hypothetical protein KJA17_01160 [Patescibacteria group bacterium]|nr:hypothetical protein [Patescibacteria group bacterium]